MKIKQELTGAFAIGLAAGVLRVAQYIWTIGPDGYYTGGLLSTLLNILLILLLGAGVLWSLLCGFYKKGQTSFDGMFARQPAVKLLTGLLGILAAADGTYRLATGDNTVISLLILAGAIGWLLLALMGSKMPGPAAILPVLQLGAMIISYFWSTYKFIQVSEYTVVVLGLCALCFFTLLVLKAAIGADCSRGRLTAAACLVTVFGFAAFLAPPVGGLSIAKLILSAEGIAAILLAALVLRQMPEVKPEPETPDIPDLSALNEYISNIPEVEEED